MPIDFTPKDVMHNLVAKFVPAFLPNHKKPYYLRVEYAPELDIHALASKAEIYDVSVDPNTIEEGLKAASQLIFYCSKDGYKIKLPFANIWIKIPGEYDGYETSLPPGKQPEIRISAPVPFQRYVERNVKVETAGIMADNGLIATAIDNATGDVDSHATINDALIIRGTGLKIGADASNKSYVGVRLQDIVSGEEWPCVLVMNEPTELRVIVPPAPTDATKHLYNIIVVTQTTVSHGQSLQKELREMRSDFRIALLPAATVTPIKDANNSTTAEPQPPKPADPA
jgi:hypothetical protein